MLKDFVTTARKMMAVGAVIITIVEDSTADGATGAQKKAKVIQTIKQQAPVLARALGLPEYLLPIFTNEGILGFMIDAIVDTANRAGSFTHNTTVTPPALEG